LEPPKSRRKKDPLRELTACEQQKLGQLSPSHSAPEVQVTRAKILLAVADGADYQDAAQAVGRRSLEAVSNLVARFDQEGLQAVHPRHSGGQKKVYDAPRANGHADSAARLTADTHVVGTGQLGRTYHSCVRLLAVCAGDYASVHAVGRLLAQHGRKHPTYLEATRDQWTAAHRNRADHRLV